MGRAILSPEIKGTSRCAIKGRNHGGHCRPGSEATIDLFGRGAISKLSGVMGSQSSPRDRSCVFRAVKGGNTIAPFTSYPMEWTKWKPPAGEEAANLREQEAYSRG